MDKAMQTNNQSGRVSLTECKNVLNKKGKHHTDAEILAIRDWLYFIAEITLSEFENKPSNQNNTHNNNENKAAWNRFV